MDTEFSEQLKRHRINNGLKGSDLARSLNVSRTYFSTVEKGAQSPPSFQHCMTLIKELNMDLEDQILFLQAAVEKKTSTELTQFHNHINKLKLDIKLNRPTTEHAMQLPIFFNLPAIFKEGHLLDVPDNTIPFPFQIADTCFGFQPQKSIPALHILQNDLLVFDTQFNNIKANQIVLIDIKGTINIQQYQLNSGDTNLYTSFFPDYVGQSFSIGNTDIKVLATLTCHLKWS
ncbi:hypothetical protein DID75_01500 [Candidatus Marinamargulisbacteria bacterium SCGC AG-410-N11]|nr:hypothetical protein DID75_01500 [Candidatus Marinamargulisbacteria bacterium SCGC AG-410-N11]